MDSLPVVSSLLTAIVIRNCSVFDFVRILVVYIVSCCDSG